MSIFKTQLPDQSSHGLSNTVSNFNPIAGVCGNCDSPAINAFEFICTTCCIDVGLSTFPYYTYTSELMDNSTSAKAKRLFFVLGY